MNPSLPYVDLVFCLKFPILNLTQRLLEEGKQNVNNDVVDGFPQHGLHAGHVVSVADSGGVPPFGKVKK